MKHLEISEETHDTIRFFCIVQGISIKDFVEQTFKDLPHLKDFEKARKKLKFLRR